MSTDATTRTPTQTLREAARQMRERASEMRAEMDRMPATWEPGYREEVRASLSGPAGDHAAPWGPDASEAVADWLEETARQDEMAPCDSPAGVCNQCEHRPDLVIADRVAREYLGEMP